jgi:catechol 2,3-dioxygenase-like lactoylglutathione lyase family enzyme
MKTSGLDHIYLSVSNLERSRKFYAEILELDIKSFPEDYPNPIFAGTFYFVVGGVEIGFIQHPETKSGDRFSEMRIGLDHLSFKAPDEEALHALAERLIQSGADTKGVETFFPGGKKYVSFRDPDNIQLEYWLD